MNWFRTILMYATLYPAILIWMMFLAVAHVCAKKTK